MPTSSASRNSVFGSASSRPTLRAMLASEGSSRPHQSRNCAMRALTSAASPWPASLICAIAAVFSGFVPEVQEESSMPDVIEVPSGLEGVVAFQTSIAEPDKEGSALRYRGVDVEELVGNVPFEKVWGLLVDGTYEPGMPPAEPHPLSVRTGNPRVDLQ